MADSIQGFSTKAALVIGLSVLVLIGMVVTAQFSKQLRTTTTANVSIVPQANISLLIGTANQYPFLQTLTPCYNESALLAASSYTIDEGGTGGGYILLNDAQSGMNGSSINCTLTYLADSTNQGHADKFTAGLAVFGTFIAILVLALVGKIIIGMFKGKE